MVATPLPDSTKSHWSAPRWRLCGSPSPLPGATTISAACERRLPRTTRKADVCRLVPRPRPNRSSLRFTSSCLAVARDPFGERVQVLAEEVARLLGRLAVGTDHLVGAAEIHLRLVQKGHREIRDVLPQDVVRAVAAERAGRGADDAAGLCIPHALAPRARSHVDRV